MSLLAHTVLALLSFELAQHAPELSEYRLVVMGRMAEMTELVG
jgi:hypothetical protein